MIRIPQFSLTRIFLIVTLVAIGCVVYRFFGFAGLTGSTIALLIILRKHQGSGMWLAAPGLFLVFVGGYSYFDSAEVLLKPNSFHGFERSSAEIVAVSAPWIALVGMAMAFRGIAKMREHEDYNVYRKD